MSYIGNQSENRVSPAFMRETLSPNGSATYFDLIHDVPGYQAENLLVTVNNVIQEPVNAYTIINDGNNRPRRLNFGVALATTDSLYVIHRGAGELYHTPPSNSVGASALQDNLKSGNVDSFTATAGQTAFTLSEIPLNAESIHVYVNGIYQKPTTNYTVTGSSTVLTLSSGILVGDEVDVHHNTIRSTVSHVADGGVTTSKIADAVGIEDSYFKIPNITTTVRDALTAAVGMIIYNTTLGMLQQYNAVGWQSIDSPPTINSFAYPDSATALDPAGSTTETIVITGSNFSVGVTVTIDGTAPTATTRNSVSQITITGFPAKSAGTYAAGLKITNVSGLTASADIIYDALPAWTTAAGSLGSFVDGAFTNSSTETIRIVAAEGSDTIDYAQVSDATGNTVITSGVAGLTLGTTGANAGYLTGTLAGDGSSTYNFYAKPTDDEGQIGAVRLFNIISTPLATGGTIIEPGAYTGGGYKSHTFLSSSSGGFVLNATTLVDILIIAGGGAGGDPHGGGGGAGGMVILPQYSMAAGTYSVVVGAGGVGTTNSNGATDSYLSGGNSSLLQDGISRTTADPTIAIGGGGGGGEANTKYGSAGGSGGGQGYWGGSALASTQTHNSGQVGASHGYAGGTGAGSGAANPGAGGGGAGGLGGNAPDQQNAGDGGIGRNNLYRTGANVMYAGGGGGSTYGNSYVAGYGTGGSGVGGDGGAQGSSGGRAATSGAVNTGSGGGGNERFDSTHASGGSGIVVIRYAV